MPPVIPVPNSTLWAALTELMTMSGTATTATVRLAAQA